MSKHFDDSFGSVAVPKRGNNALFGFSHQNTHGASDDPCRVDTNNRVRTHAYRHWPFRVLPQPSGRESEGTWSLLQSAGISHHKRCSQQEAEEIHASEWLR